MKVTLETYRKHLWTGYAMNAKVQVYADFAQTTGSAKRL